MGPKWNPQGRCRLACWLTLCSARLQQSTLTVQHALQAHYVEFTTRDIAMSKSLNSDYLAQLYIRADTKKMDKKLVHDSVEGKGLPSEAEALLVFKRG